MAASRAVAAITSVVAVPFIVRDLGWTRFGLWEAIVALSSVSTLITGPAGGTLLWRMSLAYGAGNRRTLRLLVRAGVWGALLLLGVLFPIAALFRTAVGRFLRVEAGEAETVGRVFLVLAALVFVTGINETLSALNAATQRSRVVSVSNTTGQIIMYTVSIIGLHFGLGLWAMLLGLASGQLLTMVLLVAGARRGIATLPDSPGEITYSSEGTARYFGLLEVGALSAFLRGQTDRLILARLASPVWAGYYSIAARLANLIMELSNLLYVPTIAAAGALVAAGKWSEVQLLYRHTMAIVSAGGMLLGVVLIGLPGQLIVLWVGEPVPEAATILRLIAGGTLTAVMLTGPGTAICKGIGRLGIETRYVILGLGLNVSLTVALTLTIGPVGAVIASAASWACSSVYFAHLLHKTVDLPPAPMWRNVRTLLAIAVAAFMLGYASRYIPASTGRSDALLALTLLVPAGIATVLVLGVWSGGLSLLDVWRGFRALRRSASPRIPQRWTDTP